MPGRPRKPTMAAVMKFNSKTMPVMPDSRFNRNRQINPQPVLRGQKDFDE